jgi:hypothetical protein
MSSEIYKYIDILEYFIEFHRIDAVEPEYIKACNDAVEALKYLEDKLHE